MSIRLGVAGLGGIAYGHMSKITQGKVTGLEIAALCSRSEEKMAQLSQRLGLSPVCYTDYGALLADPTLDAVLITTPHHLHPAMARAAILAGKHTLVEKPLGVDLAECEALAQLALAHPELKIGVFFNQRTAAAFQYAKAMLAAGELGDLLRATWTATSWYRTNAYYQDGGWRGRWETEGGGILMTQASHQLDMLQWLCGEPEVVASLCRTVGRTIETENEATLLLRFPNGATGQFIASAHEAPGVNRLELAGTKGLLTVEDNVRVRFTRLETDSISFNQAARDTYSKIPGQTELMDFSDENADQHALLLQNFADAITANAPLLCPLPEALASLRMAMKAYEGLKK